MERLTLNNTTTIAITPVGETAPKTVLLSKVVNAIESSDNTFIRIDGKTYTHSEIQLAILTGGASLVAKKVGTINNVAVPYLEVVKAIKTFGLQHVLKIYHTGYDYFTTSTLNKLVLIPE